MNKKLHYSYIYEKERYWLHLYWLTASILFLIGFIIILVLQSDGGFAFIVVSLVTLFISYGQYNLVKEIKQNKYVKEYLKNPVDW